LFELTTKILQQYKKAGLKIVSIESCTGGFVASSITAIAGSSDIFERGFITYSNEAKIDLGVSQNILEKHGAVSEQTAIAMAEAGLQNSLADVSIAITGIAGPSGGSEDKPVGLVHFAMQQKGEQCIIHKKYIFKGNRNEIQFQATEKALEMLLDI